MTSQRAGQSELFSGKWALVTGASSGIGLELARGVAKRGANVALAARSEDKLQTYASELEREYGVSTRVFRADLSLPGAGGELYRRVSGAGIAVEHLFNNAGVGASGPFAKSDHEKELALLRLNCEALVDLTHAALPSMVARGSGGVLNVASLQAFMPVPFMATYSASKAFVRTFSESLAEELRGSGVRVTVLCPGHVPSGFQAAAGFEDGAVDPPGGLSAAETAERGLSAYVRRERVVVTGIVNQLGAVAATALPNRLVTRLGARMMRKFGRFA